MTVARAILRRFGYRLRATFDHLTAGGEAPMLRG
jgi:hypothetical protein